MMLTCSGEKISVICFTFLCDFHCCATLEMVVLAGMTAVFMIAAVSGGSLRRNIQSSRLKERNSLNPAENTSENDGGFHAHNWLKVSTYPPTLVNVNAGARLELECEAIGSPRPTIQWFRGRKPLQKENESNRIDDTVELGSSGLGKMKSRLVLDCAMPQMEGPYTCVAYAGSRTALAPSTMVLVQGASSVTNLTATLMACQHNGQLPSTSARITAWSPVYMETIGQDVALPCRAEGYPVPDIYWLDNESQPITKADKRFKVLPNGDLFISKLRWNDMGGYTCVASNNGARDVVTTFVYPVLNEDS